MRDQRIFSQYYELHQFQDRIKWHSDLRFNLEEKDILLCDEFDDILFNDPVEFTKKLFKRRCIGFTATPSDGDAEGLEELFLS
jgi:hypothetical protein